MQPEALLNLVRRASLFDIFIISFFLLPFIAEQWLAVLGDLGWSKGDGLVVMLLAYAGGVVLMLVGSRRTARRETARDEILAYLTSKDFRMMSHERIRERINSGYDDGFLDSLAMHFPDALRKARLRGGKPGLGRIVTEDVSAEG